MRISARRQAMWWGGAALVFALALWGLGQAIMPFIIGAGVAYLLDPVADRLERAGLGRTTAVVLITAAAFLVFAAFVLFIAPLLLRQVTQLVAILPDMVERLHLFLIDRFPNLLPRTGSLSTAMSDLASIAGARAGELVRSVVGSLASVVSVVALLVIVPVVAFYLLLDWDLMVRRIDHLLPREHAPTIRRLAREIDQTLSGFLRGQGTVMLILGTFYSVALALVGLPYGVAIGAMAALLSFIPYVGVLIGGATALGVALFHFWGQPVWIGSVAAIFALGQVVEGNYLQPKIVGNHVGLHPVWLLLALSVFGGLFGFVGLMLAVPLAAGLGVLVRFAIARYLTSPLYTGAPQPPPEPTLVELVRPGTHPEIGPRPEAPPVPAAAATAPGAGGDPLSRSGA